MSAGGLRDVAYVAARLGLSVQGVYALVAQKSIAVVRLGSGRGGRGHAPLRFLDADIDAFIQARRAPAAVSSSPVVETPRPMPVAGRRRARVLDLPGADRFVPRVAAGGSR